MQRSHVYRRTWDAHIGEMRINPSVVFNETSVLVLAGFDEIAYFLAKLEVFSWRAI
jgi:hypothetical protein